MADTLKILGQVFPANTSAASLYVVPAATSAVISTIVVCNETAVAAKFRISLTPSGGTNDQTNQFLYYDVVIPAADTFVCTLGISLAAGDTIRIKTDTASSLCFTAVGVEIT